MTKPGLNVRVAILTGSPSDRDQLGKDHFMSFTGVYVQIGLLVILSREEREEMIRLWREDREPEDEESLRRMAERLTAMTSASSTQPGRPVQSD